MAFYLGANNIRRYVRNRTLNVVGNLEHSQSFLLEKLLHQWHLQGELSAKRIVEGLLRAA